MADDGRAMCSQLQGRQLVVKVGQRDGGIDDAAQAAVRFAIRAGEGNHPDVRHPAQHRLADDHGYARCGLVRAEEGTVGVAVRRFRRDALAPAQAPRLIGDPEGIDLRQLSVLQVEYVADLLRVDAARRQFVLQGVHDVEQGQVDAPGAVGDVLLDQESQVGGRVGHLLHRAGPAVEQALDTDGDDDQVDDEDTGRQQPGGMAFRAAGSGNRCVVLMVVGHAVSVVGKRSPWQAAEQEIIEKKAQATHPARPTGRGCIAELPNAV